MSEECEALGIDEGLRLEGRELVCECVSKRYGALKTDCLKSSRTLDLEISGAGNCSTNQ